MTDAPADLHAPDPLQTQIRRARDAVQADHWAPARKGVCPEIRLGRRWFSVLWLLPLGFVVLILAIAAGIELREVPAVREFIARYPGHSSAPVEYSGFPLWLRLQHFANLLLMMFIIRSGIQILADHPRLYWDKNCTPGREWFRFQHPVPQDRVWLAKDDAVTIPGWLGIPGIRHSIGLARWWHFSCDLLWLMNGLVFYGLLFATPQWQRIVPRSWDVFPNALSTALQYLSLQFPIDDGWDRYNSLQQLAYFATVFIAAPLALFSGLMQAPAMANRTGWLGRVFHRQVARSVHFFVMLWFVQFVLVHVTMVFVTGVRRNLNHITVGNDSASWAGVLIAAVGIGIVIAAWFRASPFTLTHARLVQRAGRFLVGWIKGLMEMWDPRTQYSERDIAPSLWLNGLVPTAQDFDAIRQANFATYRLRIDGLVAQPREFSYAELRAMPKQEQITNHFCIQGWSGVAKWGGVPVRHLLDLTKPLPEARYAVFYSFGEGGEGGIYYDVHKIENLRHELTILAYEMNDAPLTVPHGAPLRLRCENELGFKQVKWIRAIEFVSEFSGIGSGQGGYNEDHEFYGYRMPI